MNRQCHKRSRTNLGLARTRGPLVRLLSLTLAVTLGASPVYAQQGGDYKITQSVIPGGTYTVSACRPSIFYSVSWPTLNVWTLPARQLQCSFYKSGSTV